MSASKTKSSAPPRAVTMDSHFAKSGREEMKKLKAKGFVQTHFMVSALATEMPDGKRASFGQAVFMKGELGCLVPFVYTLELADYSDEQVASAVKALAAGLNIARKSGASDADLGIVWAEITPEVDEDPK